MRRIILAGYAIGLLLGAFLPLGGCAQLDYVVAERSSVIIEDADGHGSGVVIAPRLILTAKHVVHDINSGAMARTSDGHSLKVSPYWESEDQDIAIMQTDEDLVASIAMLTCDLPKVGDPITILGSPLDTEFVFTTGHIASTFLPRKKDKEHAKEVLMEAAVLPGDSGGAVFNAKGQVVGVAVAGLTMPVFGMGITGRFVTPSTYTVMEPVGDLCHGLPKIGA